MTIWFDNGVTCESLADDRECEALRSAFISRSIFTFTPEKETTLIDLSKALEIKVVDEQRHPSGTAKSMPKERAGADATGPINPLVGWESAAMRDEFHANKK